jgi:threonine-phosphate decarboxylase
VLSRAAKEKEVRDRARNGCSHGGVYSVDAKLVRLDCSSSVNPLGPPASVIEAIKKEARRLVPLYPDSECRALKKRISLYAKCQEEEICVGNGALEMIHLFARLYARKLAVIPAPTFCEYEDATQRAGANVTFVPLVGRQLVADAVVEKSKGADAVFLCNPNNPTGLLSTQAVVNTIERVDQSTMILLDECFIELSDRPNDTLIPRISEFDNLVILRSLTKSFGLAGLRLGYSVSNAETASRLHAMQVHWTVNGLAQAAGVAALQNAKAYLAKSRTTVKQGRAFLQKGIARIRGFTPLPSNANYFQVHVQSWDSTKLRDSLLKKSGVLVRDCSTFTGMDNHHIRVAVKKQNHNERFLDALESFEIG